MSVSINYINHSTLSANPYLTQRSCSSSASDGCTSSASPSDPVAISEAGMRLQTKGDVLDPEEQRQVNQLKQRDAEVKTHEAAHMSAGGTVVQGGASYQYQQGPDGKMYAVGGEVSIDLSAESTPEATIRKMQEVRRAAMAPAQPSGTDRAVAAQATQIEAQARIEKSEQTKEAAIKAKNTKAPDDPENQSRHPHSSQYPTGRKISLFI